MNQGKQLVHFKWNRGHQSLCESCRRLEECNKMLLDEIAKQQKQHTVYLESIIEKMYPKSHKLNIFPIATIDDLENVDKKLENIPEEQIISNIKELVGNASIAKCFVFFFANELLLKINWDGKRNRTGIKNFKIFNTFVFEAVRTEGLNYLQFEEEMRKGFRLAKGRIYKNTYNNKNN